MSDIFITADEHYDHDFIRKVRLARIGYDPDLIWYEVKEVYDEDI